MQVDSKTVVCALGTQRLKGDPALETSHHPGSILMTKEALHMCEGGGNKHPQIQSCIHMWLSAHTHTHTHTLTHRLHACTYWTRSQSYYVYFSTIASFSLYRLEYMPFSTTGLSSPWGQEPYIVPLVLEDPYKALNRGGTPKCSWIG